MGLVFPIFLGIWVIVISLFCNFIYLGACVMRVFVSPLGFHEDVVLKLLTDYRAGVGDKLFVITCGVAGAVASAYESLKAFCLKQAFPEPILINLDCSDIYGSLRVLLDKLSLSDVEKYVLEIGGGMRIAGYLALFTLIKLGKVFEIHYRSESSGLTLTIPWECIDTILHGLPDSFREVLRIVVENPGLTAKDIALTLEKKEKSVRNIISQLRKKGLIEKHSPRGAIYPTELGKTILTH